MICGASSDLDSSVDCCDVIEYSGQIARFPAINTEYSGKNVRIPWSNFEYSPTFQRNWLSSKNRNYNLILEQIENSNLILEQKETRN